MEQKNKKLDLPFEGPYKTKPSAVPGKHGIGFSTARHLARQGMAQQVKKAKTNEDNEQDVAEGSTSQQKAHEYNLDAAQKEMDSRHAEGEDMTGAKIDKKTYQIVKPKKPKVNEAEMDPREYDYEGDMAKSQLRSIIMNAQQVHDMLEDDTNMAEWVQSKITLSADYISTVADYMAAEMKEEVEPIDELNKDTLHSNKIPAVSENTFKSFRDQIAEKHLTPAEMKKREEIAKAIHKEKPGMPMGDKMAIATASAKKAA